MEVAIIRPNRGDAIQLGPVHMRILEDGSASDHRSGVGEMVPPGAQHAFANPGDEPTVLLNTFTPHFCVQYVRDLRHIIAPAQPFMPEATVEMMARYITVPATDDAD